MKMCFDFSMFFDGPFGRRFSNFGRSRGPKGVPKGTTLRPLEGTG